MGFITINKKVPCFDCSSRSISCHSNCERYKTFRNEKDAVNETVYRRRMAQNSADEYVIAQIEKCRRRTGNVR